MKSLLRKTGWRRLVIALLLLGLPVAAFAAAYAAGCCPFC